ncbi:elongation factor 1-gamma [Mycena sp. CBHHK59/15]|nr:elongation factor 1-gamma [Mycena sp. CBHHK59/15]
MSSVGTLWTVPYQASAWAIRAVAALGGVPISYPEDYVHFETNKRPEFLKKFPHGKIPAWEGKDGFLLYESVAIARYIAGLASNSGLLGKTTEEAALVDQWIHVMEAEVEANTFMINYLLHGLLAPYSKPIHNTLHERQLRGLYTLEKHISTRTFFVGERITLADVYIATMLLRACSINLDTPIRARIPNLMRHLETVINQPAVVAACIYPPIPVLDRAPVYVAPKKEKEPKPAPALPAPKAEKKPKPKVADDEDEDDNLDWKRAYSNKETRGAGGALEWFYEHYDKEGYSVWRVDFKYPEELTQTFMSSNQIGGFFNRLEASRKYLFASVGVLGAANNSLITGALILRGQEAEPVVSVAPDWESYSFTKLDLSDAAQKAFFEGALAWDLEVDGKKWVDGKNFK